MSKPEDTAPCRRCGTTDQSDMWRTFTNGGTFLHSTCNKCRVAESVEAYQVDGVIDSRLMMETAMRQGTLEVAYDVRKFKTDVPFETAILVMADKIRINEAIKRFDREAWVGKGLHARNQASTDRGFSGDFGAVRMMTWTCAGRVMITAECAGRGCSLTVVADESEPGRMGLNSLEGRASDVVEMLASLTRDVTVEGLKVDEKVGMF